MYVVNFEIKTIEQVYEALSYGFYLSNDECNFHGDSNRKNNTHHIINTQDGIAKDMIKTQTTPCVTDFIGAKAYRINHYDFRNILS